MEDGRRRSPSPDITDTTHLLRRPRKKNNEEEPPPTVPTNNEVEITDVKMEIDADLVVEEDNAGGGVSNNNKGTRGAKVGGRGRGGSRGGNNNSKRGGSNRGGRGGGKGKGKKINDGEEDISVEQIEQNVKQMQLQNEDEGGSFLLDSSSIFGTAQKGGGIPGLDCSEDAEGSGVKPLSEVLAGIKDKEDNENQSSEVMEPGVRRSSRIKSLEVQKGRSRRREVVFSSTTSLDSSLSRSMSSLNDDDSNSNNGTKDSPMDKDDASSFSSGLSSMSFTSASTSDLTDSTSWSSKPFKVKSRWRYSADAESLKSSGSTSSLGDEGGVGDDQDGTNANVLVEDEFVPSKDLVKRSGFILYNKNDNELIEKLKKFQGIEDNMFKTARSISKESKGMVCDCYLGRDDIEKGEKGCEEDCLNRLLMVECGPRCQTGDRCTNKRFQRKEYATLEVFKTEKKGHGLRTLQHIPEGGFVIEYVGEVLDPDQFEKRTKQYAKDDQEHFYFMALKSDNIIDATVKGNCSRFINHSCEPNCETQKWTVNGELRIGFFTLRDLKPGEEIVFDYQFQRYGKKAQRCYCGTPSCRGWIGEEDEDDEEVEGDDDRDESETLSPEDEGESVREVKSKKKQPRKPPTERRKKKDTASRIRILEDIALEDELKQLERTGLKNKTHTLTLSRLMIRAEKWDDRERILKILATGENPCKRLFLDYRGLKLLYNWMVNLPLPVDDAKEQAIRDENYHLLCLNTLASLQVPNKTMLLDSKVLNLMETWSNVPEKTFEICTIEKPPVEPIPPAEPMPLGEPMPDAESIPHGEPIPPAEPKPLAEPTPSAEPLPASESEPQVLAPEVEVKKEIEEMEVDYATVDVKPEIDAEIEKMEGDVQPLAEEIKPKPEEVQTETETKCTVWALKNEAKQLVDSWSNLKEEFRIPKKERVELMKAHEREADKAYSAMGLEVSAPTDTRRRWSTSSSGGGKERRVSVLDPHNNHRHFHRDRMDKIKDMFPNMSKNQRRKLFEERVAQAEEERKHKEMHDKLIKLHEARCMTLGLDHHITPMVDESGHYFLDPGSIQWIQIDPNDPNLPPGIQRMLEAVQFKEPMWYEPVPEPEIQVVDEHVFPPWPEGFLPPPPLPPASLPEGWKMAVDDEGRCYYYHVRKRQTQWTPPTIEDCFNADIESSDSSDSDSEEDEEDNVLGDVKVTPTIPTLRTRIIERAERRKRAGLVQEKIISPRTAEDKSTFSKAMIRARKLEVLEEKRKAQAAAKIQQRKAAESGENISDDSRVLQGQIEVEETTTQESSVSISQEEFEPLESNNPTPSSVHVTEEDSEEGSGPSSPIETELDISLASIGDDHDNLDNFDVTGPSESSVVIPGLGFDPRDQLSSASSSSTITPTISKKSRSSKHERKQKYKKISSDKSKEAFRNQIANVVVMYLNPYRRPDNKVGKIETTEDFKHLARKMTHAILLKELKHSREGKPLEVTDGVKQKTKEYIKKFMARFGNSRYVRSPEDNTQK